MSALNNSNQNNLKFGIFMAKALYKEKKDENFIFCIQGIASLMDLLSKASTSTTKNEITNAMVSTNAPSYKNEDFKIKYVKWFFSAKLKSPKELRNKVIAERGDYEIYRTEENNIIAENCVEFNGRWFYPTNPFLTITSKFFIAPEVSINCATLAFEGQFFVRKNHMDGLLTCMYFKSKSVYMYIYMPHNFYGIENFMINHLGNVTPNIFKFKTRRNWKVHSRIYLPKFKFNSKLNLKNVFQNQMNVKTMFQTHADFAYYPTIDSEEKKWVSNLEQNVRFEMHEKGSEYIGDAFDVDGMAEETPNHLTRKKGGPLIVKINKPFFFSIVNETRGIPLFMGVINNPTL